MNHHTHIRLVDSHTEGIGCAHHPYFVLLPSLLSLVFYVGIQSGMIKGGGNALLREQLRHLLGSLSAAGINDGGASHALQDMNHLALLILSFAYYVSQVLALETHFEDILFLEMEPFLYVVYYFGGSCGGKGKYRNARFHLPDAGYLQIGGAEVVAPLTDAVGFIYRDKTYMNVA